MCPIGGTYKLTLSTTLDKTGLTSSYTNAEPDTGDDAAGGQPKFQTGIAETGTWILYETKNYNDDKKDGQFQIIEAGQTKILDFQPKSLRPISNANYVITLYEHKNFGGKQKVFNSYQPTLTDFPIFNEAGVSAIIVNPLRSWTVFTGVNYTGSSLVLRPGRYEDPTKFAGLDERIMSIKY